MKRLCSLGALRAHGYGALLFAVVFGFFGGLFALWFTGHRDAYFGLTNFLGMDAWIRPFLDLEGVLSWAECHRLGFDVLKVNPCDPLRRLLNYGPPLVHLPFRANQAIALGLVQGTAFIAALTFAIRPRTPEEFFVAVLAILSAATLYAMERGNLDLLEFVLIALTGPLVAMGRWGRLSSYALYYLGGAIKFYPFALLIMVVRERPWTAFVLIVLFALAIGAYAAHYWPQLTAIRSLLPHFEYDSDTFGAYGLPYGLADLLGFPPAAGMLATMLLLAGFGAFTFRLTARLVSAMPVIAWDRARFHYLLCGCIVMIGCFFLQSNIDYRAIFLLLMLAGLFELRNISGATPLRRIFAVAVWVLVFCMWSDFFRRGIDKMLDWLAPERADGSLLDQLSNVFFVARELAWWWLMAVAAAIALHFVLTSPSGNAAMARLASMRRTKSA